MAVTALTNASSAVVSRARLSFAPSLQVSAVDCSTSATAPYGMTIAAINSTVIMNIEQRFRDPVTVLGGLAVAANGFLDAGSCAPTLNVTGGITVEKGGGLVLGCSPFLVVAPPTPPFPSLCPGITTRNVIKGGVKANQPLTLIFHSNTITGGVSVQGGGGGVNCDNNPNLTAAFDGPSATYTDFEDNTIAGRVSISGLQSCWFGIFRSQVNGSVSVTNNTFADADATEVATNTINGNLTCQGNSPAAQIGDSEGTLNVVTGQKFGECARL